jgi:hypothetical protein
LAVLLGLPIKKRLRREGNKQGNWSSDLYSTQTEGGLSYKDAQLISSPPSSLAHESFPESAASKD